MPARRKKQSEPYCWTFPQRPVSVVQFSDPLVRSYYAEARYGPDITLSLGDLAVFWARPEEKAYAGLGLKYCLGEVCALFSDSSSGPSVRVRWFEPSSVWALNRLTNQTGGSSAEIRTLTRADTAPSLSMLLPPGTSPEEVRTCSSHNVLHFFQLVAGGEVIETDECIDVPLDLVVNKAVLVDSFDSWRENVEWYTLLVA